MPTRRIDYMNLDDIQDALRNPKGHADELIGQSIQRFGYVEAGVLDERTNRLVGGHGRVNELRRLRDAGSDPPDGIAAAADGTWTVPVQRGWASRDDDEALAAGVALNRVGEAGGWERDDLYEILDQFRATSDDDFDMLAGIGFDSADLDKMLAEIELAKVAPPEPDDSEREETRTIIVPAPGTERTERGDVWILGEHRVMCGDCRDAADVARLIGDDTITVAFTSPPYADRRNYDETSGFQPIRPDEYVDWYAAVSENIAAHIADDGSSFVNIKAGVKPDGIESELYVIDLVLAHARLWGWHYVTEFCWERNGVPKSVTRRFKNQFEPIFQFARGDRWKIRPDAMRTPSDNVPITVPGNGIYGDPEGWQGGNTSSDWSKKQGGNGDFFEGQKLRAKRATGTSGGSADDHQGENWSPTGWSAPGLAYPGNRLPTFAGTHQATGHTAAFPVGLPAWFVRAYTDAGDVVYDPFVGSGSTLLAASRERRRGRGMELSRGYVDVVCARWQTEAGGALPIREATGETVDFLAGAAAPS